MKYIVTGANGFVGSNLVKKLVLQEETEIVFCLDLNRDYNRLPRNKKIVFMSLPLEKIDELVNRDDCYDFDVFYHFAWMGSAGHLRCDEKVQIQNALWTVDCLRVASRINCKKFVCSGSIMEFDVNDVIYSQETKPALPYIYGVGKVLAHELCKPIANQLKIELVWAYITNAYGVGEDSPRFVNTTLKKIIAKEPLEFTSATQNYDFVYIDDVANAFYLLGLHGKPNKGYIIGSGHSRPLKDFILEMCNENSENNEPVFGNIPFTGVNTPIEVFSTEEIEKDCGFVAKISFAEGTKRTLRWLRGR